MSEVNKAKQHIKAIFKSEIFLTLKSVIITMPQIYV